MGRVEAVEELVGRVLESLWRGLRVLLVIGAAAVPVLVIWFAQTRWGGRDDHWWAMATSAAALVGFAFLLSRVGVDKKIADEDIKNEKGEVVCLEGNVLSKEAAERATESQYVVRRWHFLRALYVGQDGRWSTSKLQALLWTIAVAWGLTSLIVAKWYGDSAGWDEQLRNGLQDEYLLLLGGPFAAAIASKAIVTGKVENGDLPKVEGSSSGAAEGLRQVVSDDAGDTDLIDTQYFVFNLVALAFFFGTFPFEFSKGFP